MKSLDILIDEIIFFQGSLSINGFCEQSFMTNNNYKNLSKLKSLGDKINNAGKSALILKLDFQEKYPNYNKYVFNFKLSEYPPSYQGEDYFIEALNKIKSKKEADEFCQIYISENKTLSVINKKMGKILNLLNKYRNEFYESYEYMVKFY